jgi:dihydrofolate reductase
LKSFFAIAKNKVFGQGNGLPWDRNKVDMNHFKNTTMGHVVIMGRKTFESLHVNLPGRVIIVVSSQSKEELEKTNQAPTIFGVAPSLNMAINLVDEDHVDKIFVIGGKELIREAIPLADRIHISLIDAEPKINEETVVLDFLHYEDIVEGGIWKGKEIILKVFRYDKEVLHWSRFKIYT